MVMNTLYFPANESVDICEDDDEIELEKNRLIDSKLNTGTNKMYKYDRFTLGNKK